MLLLVAIAYIRSKWRARAENRELAAFEQASSSAWSSASLIPSAPPGQLSEGPAILRAEDSVEV